MSIIHLVLLAKAVEEQQKRTGAKQSSPQKQNNKKKNDYDSALNAYYNNSSDIENFLEDLLETDKEATKLFLLLKECQKQINQEDYQASLKRVQRICSEYDKQESLLKEEERKVEATGISFDKTINIQRGYCSVKVQDGHGFGRYGSYSYNPAFYCMGFNEMPLTREMLENNTNQFQIELEEFNKENPNLDEQLADITKKIAKQNKKVKYNPFNKEKNQSLLNDMLKVEKEIKKKIDRRNTLEKQSQQFKALTPEQKKAILAYMNQVDNCIVVGQELSEAINASNAINHEYYGNNSNEERNVNQRMIERAAEQSEFTVEDIETILARIKRTIDENEVSFRRYKKLSDKSYHHPTSPESMFAAEYYDKLYREKSKTKK